MKSSFFLIAILLVHLKTSNCVYVIQGQGVVDVTQNGQRNIPIDPRIIYPIFSQQVPGQIGYHVTGSITGQVKITGDNAEQVVDGGEKEDNKDEESEKEKPKARPTVLEWSSFCYAKPNTEELVGSKSVFVTYPGLPEEAAKSESKVTLKIFNENEEVFKYMVTEEERRLEKVYRFALKNAKAGKYSSQLCVDELCSEKSAPSTEIDVGTNCDGERHMLNCQRILEDKTEKSISAPLVSVDGLATDDIVRELKGVNETVANKYGVERNGEIIVSDDEVLGYTAILYPTKKFRELMRMNDICKRKYTAVVLTYIVNKRTDQVVKIGRLTPYMPKSVYDKYLGLDINNKINGEYAIKQANLDLIPLTPIELLIDLTDLVNQKEVSGADRKGDYNIWQIPCVVRKDGSKPGITRCAEPFIYEWNYDFKKVQVPEVPQKPEVPEAKEEPGEKEVPQDQKVDDAVEQQGTTKLPQDQKVDDALKQPGEKEVPQDQKADDALKQKEVAQVEQTDDALEKSKNDDGGSQAGADKIKDSNNGGQQG